MVVTLGLASSRNTYFCRNSGLLPDGTVAYFSRFLGVSLFGAETDGVVCTFLAKPLFFSF